MSEPAEWYEELCHHGFFEGPTPDMCPDPSHRIRMQRWEGTRWQALRRRWSDLSHFLFCERSKGCYGHWDGGRYVDIEQ